MEGRQSFNQGAGARAIQGRSGLACARRLRQAGQPPMKRIVVWTLMFFVAVVGDQARSAESRVSALESCFKASRLAYAICSNPDNSPQTRLDCFHQAQAEQL